MDNHGAHTSKESRKRYAPLRILYTPAHSSDLSSIETVWSILKQKIAKTLYRIPYNLSWEGFEAEVDKACDEINQEYDGRKLFYAARKELLEALEYQDERELASAERA